MNLTKIGNNLLLTDSKGNKVLSTKDAMAIVREIKKHPETHFNGLHNLPDYYLAMIAVPVVTEAHIAQLTPNLLS